jgi:HSP20 family molecular chaperone IbpA
MSKDDRDNKDDAGGAAAFTKIARGLSDLFGVLSDLDQAPRRGRHEKDGKVMEYSFKTRTLGEAAGERDAAAEEVPARHDAPPRREPKRTSVELLEPVTDMFDEPAEILFLFELPGVDRKDIRCILDGDILLLEAKTGERLYRKETLIEGKLAGGPHLNLRNGVLEVRLSKQT